MQQVVLCFNWCALEWIGLSTRLQPRSQWVELESAVRWKSHAAFGRGERSWGPTYPYSWRKCAWAHFCSPICGWLILFSSQLYAFISQDKPETWVEHPVRKGGLLNWKMVQFTVGASISLRRIFVRILVLALHSDGKSRRIRLREPDLPCTMQDKSKANEVSIW